MPLRHSLPHLPLYFAPLRNILLHLLFILFLFAIPTLGQESGRKPVVTIKGSDTMVILVQRWTETFPDKTKVQFQVTGGGSGTGISALINGTTDICSSSRPMKPSEVKQIREKYQYNGLEIRVARDGIAVYLNDNNPVQNLTIGQVKRIFTGEITNWKELGGNDAKIVLYSRENNSGTYEFFKEHVLQKQDFASQTQHMVGTGALVNAISKDPNAIGFGGIAYASGVKPAALAFNESSRYVFPNEQEILSGNYPVSRLLYFYMKERPNGITKEFIDWIISKDGQAVVSEVGYLPTKKFSSALPSSEK